MRRLYEFRPYPWQWTPAEVEAFFSQLRSAERALALSTLRGYQVSLRLFWSSSCDARTGGPRCACSGSGRPRWWCCTSGIRWCTHAEFEGEPGRRPLTYDEVQALFDTADGRVEAIRRRQHKGATPALRDAALLKTVYAYGLRRREVCGLDLADMRHEPSCRSSAASGVVRAWGNFGAAPRSDAPY